MVAVQSNFPFALLPYCMTSRLARKALRLSNIPAGSCLNLISKDISKFVAETPEEGQRFYPHQTERAEEGITISLGEVMGHGKRCAIVDILDNGPQVPRSGKIVSSIQATLSNYCMKPFPSSLR
jgi:hypothetical protein